MQGMQALPLEAVEIHLAYTQNLENKPLIHMHGSSTHAHLEH